MIRRRSQRVLVLSNHRSLLEEGLISLIRKKRALEVMESFESENDHIKKIESLQPNVVLLVGGENCPHYSPSLAEIFQAAPRARVIVVCNCHAGLHLYDSMELPGANPEDLLRAISLPYPRWERRLRSRWAW
ncbi:MAG: hypothetical protein HY664_05085 [Chloroflexi bacterium]|nr:hypothetical protein [Chloroflexota bacterium]